MAILFMRFCVTPYLPAFNLLVTIRHHLFFSTKMIANFHILKNGVTYFIDICTLQSMLEYFCYLGISVINESESTVKPETITEDTSVSQGIKFAYSPIEENLDLPKVMCSLLPLY